MGRLTAARQKEKLETLYRQYNQRAFVDPDPLLFLYDYPKIRDREIAGLLSACLAYGRVRMIMETVRSVLNRMGPDLHGFVLNTGAGELNRMFQGFRYRFADQAHLTALILGIREILEAYGAVEACFLSGAAMGPPRSGLDVMQGLARIHAAVCRQGDPGHLLADPNKSSACKRSHLFLRWMVRQDQVDPGGWTSVPASALVVPIDTHMHKIGTYLGFTRRRAADRGCALEITRGFRRLCPEDPVRYDFALTRFGIRQQFDMDDLKKFMET